MHLLSHESSKTMSLFTKKSLVTCYKKKYIENKTEQHKIFIN